MKVGKPAVWSIGLGVGLPTLGYASDGTPTEAANVLAIVLIIPVWILTIRAIIYMWQWITRQPN